MSERTAISWCDSTFNPWLGAVVPERDCLRVTKKMLGRLALPALRYYSNHIDTESQQPQQYGSCAQERKGNTERCKSQVPGGTQRALGPKGSKGPRQNKLAGVDAPSNLESST